MNDWRFVSGPVVLAALSAVTMVIEPSAASAQSAPYAYGQNGAPPAQYAPQPQAAPPDYNAYRQQYAEWEMHNCVTQHSNNIATGAIIGGVAGVLMGASIAGWAARGAWMLFGGSLGLTAGAAIGASSTAPGCPSGYAVRNDAPPFTYAGPRYGYGAPAQYYAPAYVPPQSYAPAQYYAPLPNRGWVWDGYRWVRRPTPYSYPRPAPYAYGTY